MSDRSERLVSILDQFVGLRVLVVGDMMLDEYVIGAPARVSREAPVLILEQQRRFVLPGGGANPAVNVLSLGGVAYTVGVIGDDGTGDELCSSLSGQGVDTSALTIESGAVTTRKTRILAETASSYGQQLMRVDRVGTPPGETARDAMATSIHRLAPVVDAILLSDYKAGVVTAPIIDAAREAARAFRKLLAVDSQGGLDRFHGFDLVKCNRPDAELYLGRDLSDPPEYADAGMSLAHDLDIDCLMITLGADGISVSSRDESSYLPASNRTEVFDVTGAGDTVIAVATLALAASSSSADAAYLANLAAGEVVRRLGVATTTVPDLKRLVAAI